MSRTFRNTRHANLNARQLNVEATRRAEAAAVDALRDEGFHPRSRVTARLSKSSEGLPNRYVDRRVAGYGESAFRIAGSLTYPGYRAIHWGPDYREERDHYEAEVEVPAQLRRLAKERELLRRR